MTDTLRTHEISEIESGVFQTILEPCSAAILPHVLTPGPSFVWLVEHRPEERLLWTELTVPLVPGLPAEPLRVRGLTYDAQLSTAEFLAHVVPRLSGTPGSIRTPAPRVGEHNAVV